MADLDETWEDVDASQGAPLGRLEIRRGSGIPMHEQLRRGLRLVITQHFRAGTLFYSEKVLLERLPVSRITVRRALDDLQREGLVERLPGRGTVVRVPTQTDQSKARAVGLFVVNYGSQYVGALLKQAASACERRGLAFQTYSCLEGPHAVDSLSQIVRAAQDERILLLTPADTTPLLFHSLSSRGYRTVALDGVPPGYAGPYAVTDARAAMRLGLEHLAALGHERIIFLVNEPIRDASVVDKVDEFHRLLRERGAPPAARVVLCGTHLGEDSHAAAYQHMPEVWDVAPERRPTAILTASDPGAWAALQWFAEQNVSVPGSVSVLGFEDAPSSRFMRPALSSIAHPLAKRVEAALDMLWADTPPSLTQMSVPPTLVSRDSTGPVP